MFETIFEKFKFCANKKCKIDISDGKKIIAAVSGGSDSVCMLILLNKYYGSDNIICAHFNHKIRGEEAERDAHFVCDLAKKLNIEYVYSEADVPAYSKENRIGLEEAARILRYKFLKSIALENNSYIAVAHNQGDKIETIIHNISRGTSIDGLKGIEYKKGNIVRPLLDISKEEIKYICKYFNESYVVDSTNNDNNFTRNKIRNRIIPFLQSELSESIGEHLCQLSYLAGIDSECLDNITKTAFNSYCHIENEPFSKISINYLDYQKLDLAIKKRLIRLILSNITDSKNVTVFPENTGIYYDMISRAENAFEIKEAGKVIEIAAGVVCVTSTEGVYFSHKDCISNHEALCYKLEIEEMVLKDKNDLDFKNKADNIEYFDYDKLLSIYGNDFINKFKLREWKGNDLITPIGMTGNKKIRDVLINKKIGRFERKFVKVVSLEDDILWIPKIKRSNIATIDKYSTRVIIIKCVYYKP